MRGAWFALLLVASPAALAVQRDARLAGTYRTVTRDAKTGFVLDDNVPVGQIRWLKLERSGKWVWRDFLSGFDGTWTSSGSEVVFKILNTPAGPNRKQPPMRFKTSKSGRVLTLQHKDPNLRLEFVWDPDIEKRLQKGYRDATKRSGGS